MFSPSDKEQIIIFTRFPEPGKTKTRLIPVFGEEGAADLQRCMTEDTLERVLRLNKERSISIEIHYEGGNSEVMKRWFGKDVVCQPQESGHLGERMLRAFMKSFDVGYERVLIIGTDSPDLSIHLLQNAFDALSHSDVIIGPARDGGYYLIGFRKNDFSPEVFEGIDWGTDKVFKKTLNFLKKTGSKIHLLPKWNDVDTLNDLKDLVNRNQNTEFMSSKTIAYIFKKLGG